MSEKTPPVENEEKESEAPVGPLRARDLFLFLIGSRESITRVVRSPWSLVIGVFFVWTAGIARHYDFHLLHEVTKWIWAPFLVAAVTSSLVYVLVFLSILGFSGKRTPNFFLQYASFYGAFLMTAPIAWLYAIPLEQWLDSDPLRSAQGNIVLLAIVSLWRVVLTVRVVTVITQAPVWKTIFAVMLPLAVVTFFASILKSLDIVGIMGGVELTPTQEFKRDAYGLINISSFWIAILTLIGIFVPMGKARRGKGFFTWQLGPAPKGALVAGAVILLTWIGYALPFQLNSELREPRQKLEEMATTKAGPETGGDPSDSQVPNSKIAPNPSNQAPPETGSSLP